MAALLTLIGYGIALHVAIRSARRAQEQHALAGLFGEAERERAIARAADALVTDAERVCRANTPVP